MNNTTDRIKLRDSMLKVLSTAQEQRKTREDWIQFERDTMFDAVTRERAKLGKGPRTMKDLMVVENLACGHSDYSSKFALYCAELVLDEILPRP